jgi:hypothetical protein
VEAVSDCTEGKELSVTPVAKSECRHHISRLFALDKGRGRRAVIVMRAREGGKAACEERDGEGSGGGVRYTHDAGVLMLGRCREWRGGSCGRDGLGRGRRRVGRANACRGNGRMRAGFGRMKGAMFIEYSD